MEINPDVSLQSRDFWKEETQDFFDLEIPENPEKTLKERNCIGQSDAAH